MLKLNYKIAGNGPQNFILIHNAGGCNRFMDEPFKYLSQFGRVLNLDLRGHGESDRSDKLETYTVESFAADIFSLCKEQSIQNSVIIGLNYGALVGIEIANTQPSFASHLVLIDPPFLMEPWGVKLVQDHIDDLAKPNLTHFAADLVEAILVKPTPEIKEMAIKTFAATSQQVLRSTYENLLLWDQTSTDKLKKCLMPLLYIQSSQPFCSEAALQDLCPHLITGKVVGAGHWATLDAPEQVNAMITRFLYLATSPAA